MIKARMSLVAVLAAFVVAVPATAQARNLYGTTGGGKLVTFADKQTKVKVKSKKKSAKGNKPKKAAKAVRITKTRTVFGLPAGVRLVGIDQRPLTGELYGVGSDSAMYKLVITGDKSAVALSSGSFAGPATLNGTYFGVDFNPVPDRLRVVSDTGQNLRLDPNTTTNPMPTAPIVDGSLNPGTPRVVAAAYTNSALSPVKAASTTLYVIDSALDTLYVQSPPNNGVLTNPVKINADVPDTAGFDIAGAANAAYLTTAAGGRTVLHRLDLATGVATKVGQVATLTKKGKVKRTVLTGLAAVQG